MSLRCALLLVLVASCPTLPRARAQTALAELSRGVDALGEGRPHAAAAALENAYRIEPLPLALLNLGVAYVRLGRIAAALDVFRSYVERADRTRDARNIAAVRGEIARLQAAHATLDLHLSPSTTTLQIDGVDMVPRHGELVVAPGHRRIVARADGYEPYQQTLVVPAGRSPLRIALRSVPAHTSADRAPHRDSARAAPRRTRERKRVRTPCAIDALCMGPVLALGPPNLLGGGLHVRAGEYFGFGVDFGTLPTMKFGIASVNATLISAQLRAYPFGGALFLAAGIAYQSLSGAARERGVAVEASAGVPAFALGLGLMGRHGFVLGIDAQVMFPLSRGAVEMKMRSDPAIASFLTSQNTSAIEQEAETRVRDVLEYMPVMLQLNLLRIGYLF